MEKRSDFWVFWRSLVSVATERSVLLACLLDSYGILIDTGYFLVCLLLLFWK